MQIETNKYLKEKARKALQMAKELEAIQKSNGAHYVKLDNKTFALRQE